MILTPSPTGDDTEQLRSGFDQGILNNGIPTVNVALGAGVFTLTDTVDVYRRAPRLIGQGVGNTTDHGGGQSTTIRWAGPAGIPMFRIRDSRHALISDIYFQGHDGRPPLAALNFQWKSGDNHGSNEQITVERCLFGALPWSGPARQGGKMAHHVLFDGENGNNDSFFFRDCVFSLPAVSGVEIVNSQSVWGNFHNCTWLGGGVAKGLVTGSNTSLVNAAFDHCTTDVQANGTACVDAYSWSTERAGLIAHATGGGGKFNVYGGYWRTDHCAADFARHDKCYDGGGIHLRGIKMRNFDHKKLRATGARGGTMGHVSVENSDFDPSDMEVQSATAPSKGIRVAIREAEHESSVVVRDGAVFVPRVA